MTPPVSATPEQLDRYLTTEELAERLKVSPKTVAGWRLRKKGPAYTRVGRRALYAESSVAAFLAAREVPAGDAA